MDLISDIFGYVIPFLILLTVVVFVHELGHFWVARRCGVRVEVFSIGFGKELFGYTDRHGTRWKFASLPLGGYVKMFGQAERLTEADGRERDMTDAEKSVAFHHKSIGQRAAIVFAGPAANYLLTIISMAVLAATIGLAAPSQLAIVGDINDKSAAAEAGLKYGDRVISIDGQATELFDQLIAIVRRSEGRPLDLAIERDGRELRITAVPRLDEATGKVYQLGFSQFREYEAVGIADACIVAVSRTYEITVVVLTNLWEMIVGDRSSKELGGVIMIGKFAGDAAQRSIPDFLFLIPLLSLNLGLLNLFPIPLLDGGHLTFYAIEAVRGRPLGERAMEWGLRMGLAMVFGLMIFATWNDFVNLDVVDKVGNFIRNLVT